MQLFYYQAEEGNFGDDLNTWLWADLLSDCWQKEDDTLFIGVGTILDNNLPLKKQHIVFGSGVGNHPFSVNVTDDSWDIHCVRGPLTAQVLGLDTRKVVTDSALLIREFYDPVLVHKRRGTLFIPHISAVKDGCWPEVCRLAGVKYIDPRTDSKKVIEEIAQAELVIADAMHAAIFADAMRVPWVPVVTTVEINTFKWLDWTMSMQLTYKPMILTQSSLREHVKNMFFFWGDNVQTLFLDTIDANQQLNLPKNAQELALANYYERVGQSAGMQQKWMRRLYRRFVRPILNSSVVKLLCAPLGRVYMRKVAKDLQQAARLPTYLSDDKLCEQKLQRLRGFVEDIKKND